MGLVEEEDENGESEMVRWVAWTPIAEWGSRM